MHPNRKCPFLKRMHCINMSNGQFTLPESGPQVKSQCQPLHPQHNFPGSERMVRGLPIGSASRRSPRRVVS